MHNTLQSEKTSNSNSIGHEATNSQYNWNVQLAPTLFFLIVKKVVNMEEAGKYLKTLTST